MSELCLNLSAIAGYWNTARDLRAVLEVAPTLRGSAVVGPYLLYRRTEFLVDVEPHDPPTPQYGTVRLRRSECQVLPLVLKGRWYRMIEEGRKREEFRDLTRYWHERLLRFNRRYFETRKTRVVEFRLGYAADAPRMAWEIVPVGPYGDSCFAILDGRRDGGETVGEPKGTHFSIQLGRRVEWEGGAWGMSTRAARCVVAEMRMRSADLYRGTCRPTADV